MINNIHKNRVDAFGAKNKTVYLLPDGNFKITAQSFPCVTKLAGLNPASREETETIKTLLKTEFRGVKPRSDDNTENILGRLSMSCYVLPYGTYLSDAQSYASGYVRSGNITLLFIPVVTFNFARISKLGRITKAGVRFKTDSGDNAECVMRRFDSGTSGAVVSYDDDGYFDLTPIISTAVKGDVDLCIENENPDAVKYFSSNDSDDVNSRPILEVTYIPYESALLGQQYFTASAGEISCAVDILTGVPYISRPLLSLGGLKMPLALSLNYNTKNLSDESIGSSGLPVGWATNYSRFCKASTFTAGDGKTEKCHVYIDGQGKRHIFRPAQNSSVLWADSCGTGLVLKETSGGTEISDENGNFMYFDIHGRLKKLVGKMSKTATAETNIEYSDDNSSRIRTITDGMGRRATFSYGVASVTVSYNGLEKVTVKKDSNGCILQIIRKSGGVSEIDNFTSASSGEITGMTAANGEKIELDYVDSPRLSKLVTRQNDRTQIFSYGFLQTTITDNKGVTQVYNFDEGGEIVNSYEKNADDQSGISFVDRESCQYYSGRLLTGVYNTFVFGSIPGIFLENVTEPRTIEPSQSVTCYEVTTKDFAVFAARAEVEGAYKATENEESKIRIELWDSLSPANKLCEAEFDPFADGAQIAAKPFLALSDRAMAAHVFKLKIRIDCRAAAVRLFGLSIGPMNSAVERVCCDKDLGYGSYPNVGNNYFMSKNDGVSFGSGVSVGGEIVLQSEDYIANAKNYQTRKGGSWNFWYDRKRKMVANITNAVVSFPSGRTFDFSKDKLSEISVDNAANAVGVQKTYDTSSDCYLTVHQRSYNEAMGEKHSYYYYGDCYNLLKSQTEQTVAENTYDSDGYLTKEKVAENATPAYSITSEYSYSDDFLVQEKDCLLSTSSATKYGYDLFGNVTKITAPNSFATDYTFDTFGDRLEKVSGTISGVVNKNDITYGGGKVTKVSHGGVNYDFGYDERGNINSVKINDTLYLGRTFTYSDDVDTVRTFYSNDRIVYTSTYDKYDRLVKQGAASYIYASPTNADELAAAYAATSYDDSGFPVNSSSLPYKVIDNYCSSVTKLAYNKLNNLISAVETLPSGSELSYTVEYNERNLPNAVTYSHAGKTLQSLAFAYRDDSLEYGDEVKSTTTKCGTTTVVSSTTRDKLNRISGEGLVNGYFQTDKKYEYFADDIHSNGTTNCVKSCTTRFFAFGQKAYETTDSFEYDINRNITKQTFTNKGAPYSITYGYDAYNRLTRENNPGMGKSYTYEYDAGGNITRKREYAFSAGSLGSATKTYNYTYGGGDRLTAWDGKTFAYDSCGNPTAYKGENMTWTRGRLLASYTKSGTRYSFAYDANGIRRRKTTSAGYTEYLVSNGKLVGQDTYASGSSTPNRKIVFLYAHSGMIGCAIDSTVYTYKKDVFGNVVALMSGIGEVARYEYDAWGNCRVFNPDGTENTSSTFAGNINPIRYRSYYYDTDLGLYYLQTRYYDSATGRFINLDAIEYLAPETLNGLNLYAYCLNNPVMNIDPNGTIAAFTIFLIASIALGAIIGGATNTYIAYEKGASGLDLLGAAVGGAIMGGAMGAVMTIGGAAGLISLGIPVAGFGLSAGAAVGLSVGIGVGAGLASYSAENLIKTTPSWNLKDFALSGVSGGIQAATTFGIAYVGGRAGLFNKLAKMEPLEFFIYITENFDAVSKSQAFAYAAGMLVSNPIARTLICSMPGAAIRALIKKLIGC
ncbi:MAG: RHS repeat-associated core domain-containing protein [Clostridia bacterium]|nr:RHS repeat-associated core domain-containing protein [Clostridia bacterium]